MAVRISAELFDRFPKPEGELRYGTAGFRMEASRLPSTMFRMGLLAALKSRQLRKAVGVMVTASHNPEADNGCKICDYDGGMIDPTWEQYATMLAGAESLDEFHNRLDDIVQKESINVAPTTEVDSYAMVLVGMDTRTSSLSLAQAVITGVEQLPGQQVRVKDMGLVTTPQLHWAVERFNKGLQFTVDSYNRWIETQFRELLREENVEHCSITIDCANGVGAKGFQPLVVPLQDVLTVELRNTGTGVLNEQCGSEFVQKQLQAPQNFDPRKDRGKLLAACDGDCDRLVLFYFDDKEQFHLLDGDKILTLLCTLIKYLLNVLHSNLTVGCVQTAYANGASTEHIRRELTVPVEMVPTGVKHLHAKAHSFDVGLYFEANGHGTVLFNDRFHQEISSLETKHRLEEVSKQERLALIQLRALSLLSNQAVGDAIADLFMVLGASILLKWDKEKWNAVYTDRPSRMLAVKVPDRTIFKPIADESRLTEPAAIQQGIDKLVSQTKGGRAFVRPSGTEDVVRIYAEATTREEADRLAKRIEELVAKQ